MSAEQQKIDPKQAAEILQTGDLSAVHDLYKKTQGNFPLTEGYTPLHHAAKNTKHPEVLLYLIQHRGLADKINTQNSYDHYPIGLAASSRNIKGIQILIVEKAQYENIFLPMCASNIFDSLASLFPTDLESIKEIRRSIDNKSQTVIIQQLQNEVDSFMSSLNQASSISHEINPDEITAISPLSYFWSCIGRASLSSSNNYTKLVNSSLERSKKA